MANNPYVNKVQLADGNSLIDLTGDTVSANDVTQGVIFHLPTGQQSVGTHVDSTFVVTLSYNDQTEMWEPDCTYAQLLAACVANKDVTVQVDVESGMASADGNVNYYPSQNYCELIYWVRKFDDTEVATIIEQGYVFSDSGLSMSDDYSYIIPYGTVNITAAGNTDVTNYTTASVPQADASAATASVQYITENSQRKWSLTYGAYAEGAGWIDEGPFGSTHTYKYNAIPSNTTITPTTSSQTVGGANYMMEGAVTVAAIPSQYVIPTGTLTIASSGTKDVTNYASVSIASGTAGTPSASKGSVSNHSIAITPSVTNTTGWITGSTKTGTEVTVSASELVSGTYNVSSSGTADVTNYANASVPSLTLPSGASSSSSGTKKATIFPNTEGSRYINIPTGYNDTAQHYELSQVYLETLSVTENGTYYPEDVGFSSVTVNVAGGGGSSMQTDTAEAVPQSTSTLTFTGLKGIPLYFGVTVDSDVATGTPAKICALVYDGTTLHGQTITNTTNAQVSYDGSSFSHSYSNGTLTITSTGASFIQNNLSYIDYAYGGSAANVNSKDVQVGSGATSITFTGLEDEPILWSCIFKSNFSSSSGYQRVIYTAKLDNTVIGYAMDSSAHNSSSYWTATYNNGSLTITSQGTNAGGYFHQPGYYQLTYVLGEASPYQAKTVTPTTSQQVVEPDTGYDALSRVTVNAIPSEYIIPTGNYAITANGNNINIAQYATVSVNVPSGGGANFATATMTNSSNQNTSISFTLPSGRTPKAFFCRLTSQITRNSSSRYYYVFDMRWDGSATGGVAGNQFYMYSGQLSNITSGYSKSQDGTTFTLTTTGTRSASPGSFYNGTYELVYVY